MTAQERKHARAMAAYEQNSQSFRSLNQLMWQIPLLSMSLTGGLWFGVARAESSTAFQLGLLALAGFGNLTLIVAVQRLRYIMDEYLEWLQAFDTTGFVAAKADKPSDRWWNKPLVIRKAFQAMFALAAATSFALMFPIVTESKWWGARSERSAAFYDRAAQDLVDNYEAIDFIDAHPWLVAELSGKAPKNILDVGSGTGRDAAAMARLGHRVTATEPSDRMRSLARALHPNDKIRWKDDALPNLSSLKDGNERFDIVVLSAVWMHIHPKDRLTALERLSDILTVDGQIYITLRTGPADKERDIYVVTPDELASLATQAGLLMEQIDDKPDLLGRTSIRWKTVILSKPAPLPPRATKQAPPVH